jgi:hypothetical protein
MRSTIVLALSLCGIVGCTSRPSAFDFEESEVDSILVRQFGSLGLVRSYTLRGNEMVRLAHSIRAATPSDGMVLKVELKYEMRIYLRSGVALLFLSNGRLASLDTTKHFMVLADTVRLVEPYP